MTYTLTTEHFSGPLEKLLELVEERKLEITLVSLAEVTNDFIRYVESLKSDGAGEDGDASPVDPRELADFVVVASRLILIKSRSLLPDFALTREEEEAVHDLELKLVLYRELRPALKAVAKQWREPNWEMGRPYLFSVNRPTLGNFFGGEVPFYPPKDIRPEYLRRALRGILADLERFALDTVEVKEKIVSIEEKIAEIVGRLGKEVETSLSRLSENRSRSEIIVVFLAILQLAREQVIRLEQEVRFSDIMVKKNTA